MTRRTRALRTGAVAGIAAAGLLFGHFLGYLTVFPESGHRAHVLGATGHSYLPRAGVAAAAAGAAGLVAVAALGALGSKRRCRPRPRLMRSAALLAAIQVGGFIALEISERAASGSDFGDVGPLLWLGALGQILVACLGALVLRAVYRAARAVAQRFRRARPPSAPRISQPAAEAALRPLLFVDRVRPRAPPPLLLA